MHETPPISPEYISGTESRQTPSVSEQLDNRVDQPPNIIDKIETVRYGLGKPQRLRITGKITNGAS